MRGVGLLHGAGLSDAVKGTVSDQMHHVTDWLPTLLSAAKQGVTGDPASAHGGAASTVLYT